MFGPRLRSLPFCGAVDVAGKIANRPRSSVHDVLYPKPASNATLMMTQNFSSTEFHLFVEESFDPSGLAPTRPDQGAEAWPGHSPPANQPLILGPGPARLGRDESGAPSLFHTPASSPDPGPRFESITGPDAQPRLLLVTEPKHPARVNGLRAPRVTLLRAGDRLHFDGTTSFRVAIYYRPRLGPVPAEIVGVACPICTIPLAEGDQCLLCRCGAPFHAAADDSREGALACALMAGECPRCLLPLQTVPAYQPPLDPLHDQA